MALWTPQNFLRCPTMVGNVSLFLHLAPSLLPSSRGPCRFFFLNFYRFFTFSLQLTIWNMKLETWLEVLWKQVLFIFLFWYYAPSVEHSLKIHLISYIKSVIQIFHQMKILRVSNQTTRFKDDVQINLRRILYSVWKYLRPRKVNSFRQTMKILS